MRIREYRSEDLARLRAMHAKQGFRYALPDIDDGSFLLRTVVENDAGKPAMAALARLTSEVYLLTDPEAGTPRERWEWLRSLHRAATQEAWRRGIDDAHCWLPPEIAKSFGRRLLRLGWSQPAWTCYWLPLGKPGSEWSAT